MEHVVGIYSIQEEFDKDKFNVLCIDDRVYKMSKQDVIDLIHNKQVVNAIVTRDGKIRINNKNNKAFTWNELAYRIFKRHGVHLIDEKYDSRTARYEYVTYMYGNSDSTEYRINKVTYVLGLQDVCKDSTKIRLKCSIHINLIYNSEKFEYIINFGARELNYSEFKCVVAYLIDKSTNINVKKLKTKKER